MISYKLSVQQASSHYIDVEMCIDAVASDALALQLPAWRPGRYELGNFAKNIKALKAFDESGKELLYAKETKDRWVFQTKGVKTVKVSYSYFTSEINAGSCYADDTQLYVNPVHLCMYVPERMQEKHVIELDVPANYKVAGSLQIEVHKLTAAHFDELADSPFMAGSRLQSDYYECGGVKFWLHFQGECKPDMERIKKDFVAFTETQLRFWGSIPVNEYHFLFQILPYKFYHGVEHQKSTVIALGPGYALNRGKTYEDFLGVSSHELFHTWNIKYIRPAEMLPYDFTKENYARTGYVYEGFTTYYGDLMLWASGVFTDEQYYDTLEERLLKHFHNYGRFNLSVAASSWDTWLDGYVPGAPYRKTSIYDEGNLVAFMLDVMIRKYSGGKHALSDVCRKLYTDYGKQNKGYSESDVISICEEMAGISLQSFFSDIVYGTQSYEPQLKACFDFVGLDMVKVPGVHPAERDFGFKTTEHGLIRKVSMVAPGSPAWDAGIGIGDDILSVNGYSLKNDLDEWLNYFAAEAVFLMVQSGGKLKEVELKKVQEQRYFDVIRLRAKTTLSPEEAQNAKNWQYGMSR
ncbi:MAG: M61 family metallopeptidase [Bacteroidetes bacterium]|nr:M61 family metallopeptidase [Bacteroidota bacterium]